MHISTGCRPRRVSYNALCMAWHRISIPGSDCIVVIEKTHSYGVVRREVFNMTQTMSTTLGTVLSLDKLQAYPRIM